MPLTRRSLATALASPMLASTARAAAPRFAGGPVGGLYLPLAQALCASLPGACSAAESEGSVANLRALSAGVAEFALAQSDIVLDALAGEGRFAVDGPMPGLRAIAGLHVEPVTVVVRGDWPGLNLEDLRGLQLDPGPAGSGPAATLTRIGLALGLSELDLAVAAPDAEAQTQALCSGGIDAALLVVGYPNPRVAALLSACGGRLVPVDGLATRQLVRDRPEYGRAVIPSHSYPGQDNEIETLGPRALLLTTERVAQAAARDMALTVLDGISGLATLSPAFASLSPGDLLSLPAGLLFHPGATAAWRERGLTG